MKPPFTAAILLPTKETTRLVTIKMMIQKKIIWGLTQTSLDDLTL
jgi:hypothetical protein